MDQATIEATGFAPIQAELETISKIEDLKGLTAAFADSARRSRTSPFNTEVAQDDRAPDTYVANISQGGLGLPDRDMYDVKNKQFDAVRAGYQKYLATELSLVGVKDARQACEDLVTPVLRRR